MEDNMTADCPDTVYTCGACGVRVSEETALRLADVDQTGHGTVCGECAEVRCDQCHSVVRLRYVHRVGHDYWCEGCCIEDEAASEPDRDKDDGCPI